MSAKWYYARDNKAIGPFTADEMKRLYNEETIQDATFVWCEGAPDWKFYRDTELSMDSLPPDYEPEEETVVLVDQETDSDPRKEAAYDEYTDHTEQKSEKADWYYLKGVTPQGPFTKEEMSSLFEKGKINKDTLVLISGEENWQNYKDSKLYIPAAKVELMPDKTDISMPEQEEYDNGATEVYTDDKTSMDPYEYNAFDDFGSEADEKEEWYIDQDGPYTLRALRAMYKRGNIAESSIIAKADGTTLPLSLLQDDELPQKKQDQWFLARNGKAEGPYDPTDIINWVLSKQIPLDTQIWKDGMSDWIKIGESDLLTESQKQSLMPKQEKKETQPKKSKLALIIGILAGICILGGIGFFLFGKGPKEEIQASSFTGNWKLSKYAPADGDFWDLSLSEVQKLRMSVEDDGDITIQTNGRDIYAGSWTIDGDVADIQGNLNDESTNLELSVNEDGEVVIKQKSDVTLIFVEDADAPLTSEESKPSETAQSEPEPEPEPATNPELGNYKVNYDMNLRSQPNRYSSDAGDIGAGSTVNIVEIENNSDGKWGKLSDGRWICMVDSDYTYLTKQ